MNKGWIAVDLDGTLAQYDGWVNSSTIGEPVPRMLERVKAWLAEGEDVRIFTARVGPQKDVNESVRAREAIGKWCVEHVGQELPVTATKDFAMKALWDDRCVQVVPNTGTAIEDISRAASAVVLSLQNQEPPAEISRLMDEFTSLL